MSGNHDYFPKFSLRIKWDRLVDEMDIFQQTDLFLSFFTICQPLIHRLYTASCGLYFNIFFVDILWCTSINQGTTNTCCLLWINGNQRFIFYPNPLFPWVEGRFFLTIGGGTTHLGMFKPDTKQSHFLSAFCF